MSRTGLRPIERVVLRLRDEGLSVPEIARKVNRRPGTVQRLFEIAAFRQGADLKGGREKSGLRPIERVVLDWRARGESYGEIGHRIARSGAQARRIEEWANFKLENGYA